MKDQSRKQEPEVLTSWHCTNKMSNVMPPTPPRMCHQWGFHLGPSAPQPWLNSSSARPLSFLRISYYASVGTHAVSRLSLRGWRWQQGQGRCASGVETHGRAVMPFDGSCCEHAAETLVLSSAQSHSTGK
ncbi:hypothetical protein KIL84_007447 [Mauremys mutica]|uniref:Uncharacterized protein n=1 Tax=Mauremys mutica TaxID=74926 RepID=A0A9D3X123_9SAUR|nr:hypothetical protein KIL84_007447 [Mauremys mutica]